MRSCKEISRLTSDSLDRELPLMTRMGMRLYMWMCKHCARYMEQLAFLHEVVGRHAEQAVAEADDGPRLSDEGEQRLDRIIQESLEG